MKKYGSWISKAKSYKEMGEFWDTHDLTELWDRTKKISFEVDIESEVTYYSLNRSLAERVESFAQKREGSADTLITLWVQEKSWTKILNNLSGKTI